MKRGDIVTVALPGDYGKPRPALVIQSDVFQSDESLTVLPITTHVLDAPVVRIGIGLDAGLERPSQIQVDKVQTARLGRFGRVIGQADEATLRAVNRALAVFLGLA